MIQVVRLTALQDSLRRYAVYYDDECVGLFRRYLEATDYARAYKSCREQEIVSLWAER